jgi:hypothetical protein
MEVLSIPTFNEAQRRIIERRTPTQFIKSRPGRGGKAFDYIEVGYVVTQLNEAFHFMWDFEVEDQQVGKTHVWVRGKLRIHVAPDFSIVKSAYGGSEVKRDKSGNVIEIADDLKAAAADALKKAASFLGIASDVYYPSIRAEEPRRTLEARTDTALTPATVANGKCSACASVGKYHAKGCVGARSA